MSVPPIVAMVTVRSGVSDAFLFVTVWCAVKAPMSAAVSVRAALPS